MKKGIPRPILALLLAGVILVGYSFWLVRHSISANDLALSAVFSLALFLPIGIAGFAIVTTLAVAQGMRKKPRMARLTAGLCARCGYNVTGNVSGVCPECGQKVG